MDINNLYDTKTTIKIVNIINKNALNEEKHSRLNKTLIILE